MSELELWAGAECTVNRVGDVYFDQLHRTRAFERLDDIDRLAELGVRALRFPVLWERVAPNGLETADFAWTDARLERLRQAKIRPILGLLHHGSGPRDTDLCAVDFAERFAKFALLVARRYPWVEDYTPINEPLTTARFSALYGFWYPHQRDTSSFLRALLNQVEATRAAMRAIRRVNPSARLIQTEDAGYTRATPELLDQARYENERRWLSFDLLFGNVDQFHPLRRHLEEHGVASSRLDVLRAEPCRPDLVGLNYYLTSDRFLDHRVEHYPRSSWGGNGRQRYVDVEAVRVLPEGARSHRQVLSEAWQRYRVPLALTEVHLGCSREQQLRWFRQAWLDSERALRDGVDVRAVTLWSLFGSYDWSNLVTRDTGHYEVGAYDVRGGTPRETAILELASRLSRGLEPANPLTEAEGWWERPERLLHFPDGKRSAIAPQTREEPMHVLILGSGGLATSVYRVCRERGLHAVVHGLDSAPQVLARIEASRPWAVILAVPPSGTSRTATLLAELSPSLGHLPVLAFSSELIVESCDWEETLRRALPHALVVRSEPLLAGIETAVDLLVDGERGVWVGFRRAG
jgi:dTDP-4-dehydrorhamnose reductase